MRRIVAAYTKSAHRGTLHPPGIQHARAGLGIALQADPEAFADGRVDPFPSSVYAPFSEVVVDHRPSGEVMGKQAPSSSR